MTWRIIEPFAGTGAVTAGLMGAPASLVPYQGSKWKYRKAIADVFMSCGFWGVPSSATLIDAGTTGYSQGMSRDEVLSLASDAANTGARVVVSEAEPLPLAGWAHVQLQTRTQRMHAKNRKAATEWLTVSP